MSLSSRPLALWLAASFACMGCRTSATSTTLAAAGPGAVAASATQTMCLSVMGNGPNFPSHLGIIAALLERNVDPVVVAGASSGSLVTPFVRMIMINQSVNSAPATDAAGRPLTPPQKAARVLAATSPLLENFLFLPAVNEGLSFLSSFVKYYLGTAQANAFVGGPGTVLAHLESSSGQALMMMAFLRDADFSALVAEPNVKKRVALMQAMWVKAANMIQVTSADFANAMMTPASAPEFTAHFKDIRDRYFKLFRTAIDAPGSGPAEYEAAYDQQVALAYPVLRLISPERKAAIFQTLLNQVKPLPLIGSLAVQFSNAFYLVDPDMSYQAFLGKDLQGNPLYMPPNAVINTTALTDDLQNGSWVDRTGRENFYQGYYADKDGAGQLAAAKAAVPAGRGFLEYPTATGYGTLMDPQHVYIVSNPLLADAVKPSIAEPDTMRRGPVVWSGGQDAAAQGLNLGGGTLITYGGWLERVSLATEARLAKCQPDAVDYMVQISADAPVNSFQLQGLRGAIEGNGAFATASTPVDPQIQGIYNDLLNFIAYAKTIKGGKGNIAMEFDWNHPSSLTGSAETTMDAAIQAYHSAIMLASYQYASKQLAALPGLPNDQATATIAFGDLSGIDVSAAPDDQTLHNIVAGVLFN